MLITYLAALVLLGFAFRALLAVIAIPLALLSILVSRRADDRMQLWSVVFNQGIIALLYTAYIAIITLLFTSNEVVSVSWPYFLIGMVWVFFTLGSNAAAKSQERGEFGLWQTPEQEAAATGAAIGVLLGLVGFPLFYNMPELVLIIPGADWFLSWSYNLGLWLSQFGIVRLILLFVVGGYVLNTGFMALVGSIMLLTFLWSRLTGRSSEPNA